MYLRDLIQRHLRAVVVDVDGIQHVHVGAPGARGRHGLTEIFDRLVHAGLELDVRDL